MTTLSVVGTPYTDRIQAYVQAHYAAEEADLMRRMLPRARAAGLPMIQIAPEQARVLRWLVRTTGAREALDVGTLFGYSAAVLATALPEDGHVVTMEAFEPHAEVAMANFQELGIAERIDVVVGPALDAMRSLEDRTFDFVLVDADKGNYVNYLEESVRLVRPGGIVAFDNAFGFGLVADEDFVGSDPERADVVAIRRFNDAFSSHPRIESALIPVGDGLAVGRVRPE